VVVGWVVAAAVLTRGTDPFPRMRRGGRRMSLYWGGAGRGGVGERGRGGGDVNQIEG